MTRNKTDGTWIRSMPVMRWNVHLACNQTCTYCVSGSSPRNDFGVISDEKRMAQIETFFLREGPFNILFTGGEPLITPGIFDLFRRLRDYLAERDVVVAGRPLPDGVPIASSRRGTASRGQ